MDTITVAFYEDDLIGDPLYICEMISPPGIGEDVSLPIKFGGTVIKVGWEITRDNEVYVSVTLKRY